MNGEHSLSGVYAYPQTDIWKSVNMANDRDKYNRYAHTDFAFDRDMSINSPTKLNLQAPDHFNVTTEPCSSFLRINNVGFIMTGTPLASNEKCIKLLDIVRYPALTEYIYSTH